MGDLGAPGAPLVKHLGTALWITILSVAVIAIGAGFLSGRSLQRAAAAALPATAFDDSVPATQMQRSLFGARGPDADFDPVDAPVDEVVVSRPRGWAPADAPGPRDRVRLAIVILGIGEDRTLDAQFEAFPYPLTFAPAADADPPSQPLRSDPRALVISADRGLSPDEIGEALRRFKAGGIMTPIVGEGPQASTIVRRLAHTNAFAIDGMGGEAPLTYRRARAGGVATATRDIVIDAYEEQSYIAFMLRQAGRLARNTGAAIAVGRAYPETYEALRRTLPQLAADNIEVVPVGDLVR